MITSPEDRARLDEMHVSKAQALVTGRSLQGDTLTLKSQISKAAKLAENCGSMVVFEQWMRYQAGRGVQPWAADGRVFVDDVVAYFNNVRSEIGMIMSDRSEQERKQAAMLEMARFLGFLRRATIAHGVGGARRR